MAIDVDARQGAWRAVDLRLVAVAVVAVVHLALIWRWSFIPLLDWPNHMARHHIEMLALTGRELPPGYRVEWLLSANLGSDLIVPWLLMWLDPFTASKVFLSLCVAVFVGGCCWFIAEAARPERRNVWLGALLVAPLAFNAFFMLGFINYYAGIGLSFLALGMMLWSLRRRSLSWPIAGLQGLLVCLLLLFHLVSWATYLVIAAAFVAGSHLQRWRDDGRLEIDWRTVLWVAGTALPSLLLCAVIMLGSIGDALGGGAPEYPTLLRKFMLLAAPFSGTTRRPDAIVLVLWLAAAGTLWLAAARLWTRFHWLQLAIVALLALYFVMPKQIGTTASADVRILPHLVVCGIAWLTTMPASRIGLGIVLAAAALSVRLVSVGSHWHDQANAIAGFARAFEAIETRARVMPVEIPAAGQDHLPPTRHMLGWAVISRRLDVPTLFAFAGQQPLRRTGPRAIHADTGSPTVTFDAPRARADYDYVWLMNWPGRPVAVPPGWQVVHRGGPLTVWRIR